MVLGRENDPLESVAETYFSNPATYEESIGELVVGLVFGKKILLYSFNTKSRYQNAKSCVRYYALLSESN